MNKLNFIKKITVTFCMLCLVMGSFALTTIDVKADDFPPITVSFDPNDESVIVEGIPDYSSANLYNYSVEGYLNYNGERVETFCYGPAALPYHIPEKQAYIFNWKDIEFILPCSGEYTFTAYLTRLYYQDGQECKDKGPKTTITITLHKQDESTNWGPGLPNTTIEPYELNEIQGSNSTITIEEEGYTWAINGNDIVTVPDTNVSLKITPDEDPFSHEGIDDFFGRTLVVKFNIEHDGDFGFTALLNYFVGTEYSGKWANLFYLAGDGTYEYLSGMIVSEDGMVTFPFTHASDYVIAITDEEYTGQALNPSPEPTPEPEAPATEAGVNAPSGNTTNSETDTTESTGTDNGAENTATSGTAEENSAATTAPNEPGSQTNSGTQDDSGINSTPPSEEGLNPIVIIVPIIIIAAVILGTVLIIKKRK
ncbi:MAG: hypothetical protein IJX66_03065 [Lachnospiraceae bacterium]|nr:hypothetical protein [Lachnospiraceae bacterium]